ncbi:MAG TPA: hypothetical protein VH089_14215 [Streptosporangiaceae bacterium]|jgi:hypothetical protein|nr:hypothetical protein [Streptosporangiaceae bacterium]
MNAIFKGIRPLDYVLAALATGAGVFLMIENMTTDGHGLSHPLSTSTWAMLPVFLAVTVPILWRRRNILAVVGVTAVAAAAHVLLFGWLTRCGVVLPLSFALAYGVARFAAGRRDHLIGLAGILLLVAVTLVRDSSATFTGAMPIAVVGGAIFYGIGRFVQVRVDKKASQQVREEQPAPTAVAA